MLLCALIGQGQVEMYETITDLAAQNIDTKQLLGLITYEDSGDKSEDVYSYKDESDNFDEVEKGKAQSARI